MSKVYLGRVVGINFEPAKSNFRKMIKYFNSIPADKIKPVITLKEDPNNPYDANAVEVHLSQEGGSPLRIGFVPKPNNIDVLKVGIGNVSVSVVQLNFKDGEAVGMDILIESTSLH